MDREWNDNQPIYRQLRDRVVAMILDAVLKEGDVLPSVRNVAADYRVNPLTVLKGYQQLVDEGLVETRRVSACSSKPAPAVCCCKANARNSRRRMAEGLRNHSAAGSQARRTARRSRKTPAEADNPS